MAQPIPMEPGPKGKVKSMRKSRKCGVLGVLVLAVLLGLMLAAPAGAATRTAGAYTSYLYGEDLNDFDFWMGGNGLAAHFTGLTQSWKIVGDDWRATGLGINTFGGNYGMKGGPFFGTGVQPVGTWNGDVFVAAAGDVYWTFTFHGWAPFDLEQPIITRFEGKGVGGAIAGLHMAGYETLPQVPGNVATGTFVIW
jgi:hypothetical protein